VEGHDVVDKARVPSVAEVDPLVFGPPFGPYLSEPFDHQLPQQMELHHLVFGSFVVNQIVHEVPRPRNRLPRKENVFWIYNLSQLFEQLESALQADDRVALRNLHSLLKFFEGQVFQSETSDIKITIHLKFLGREVVLSEHMETGNSYEI